MANLTTKAVLLVLWLIAGLAAPVSAASGDEMILGEATIFIPQDWQITDQRRDVEVGLAGSSGENLRVFWWFPDEPLLGYDGEISHETRSFPAGPALVIRSRIAGRSIVRVAFERESADGERLLFLIESENDSVETLEASLEPLLQALRFSGDPEPVTQAPSLPDAGDWNHDVAGNVSLQVPQGWRIYGADLPGVRRLSILAPGGDAIVLVAVSDEVGVMDTFETRFYQDQVIPRQIDDESYEPVAGMDGHAISVSARIYGIGDISMPYNRASAWVFRGEASGRAIMLAFVHAADAADDQRRMLRAIVESFVTGPPPDGAPATEAPVAAQPLPDAPQVAEGDAAAAIGEVARKIEVAPSRPESFDTILKALNPAHGGDCLVVAASGLPSFSALNGVSFAPDAAALCTGSGTTIVSVTLPQDPRKGQSGPLGRAYMRIFLAQGGAPVVLVDQSHGALVSLTATSGAGIAVGVSDLAEPAAPDDAVAVEPAQDGTTQLFLGKLDAAWLPHTVRDGNFDEWARFEAGMLSVDVQSPSSYGTTGLKSAEPMVRLPSPGETQSVLVQFDFDTATTNNAMFALVPPDQLGKLDWDSHEIWVAIEQKRDAEPELILAVQRKVQGRYPVTNRDVLKGLTLELQPDGLVLVSNDAGRVLLEGRMAAVPAATDLHIQVSATSPGANVSAHLDLRSIVLRQKAFDPTSDPALVLAATPHEVTLFDGRAKGLHFDVHGSVGQDLKEKLAIADGLRVVSPKGDGLTGLGIYTPEPVVWLDKFSKGASARLRFDFDPAQTDGFRLALAVPYGKSHMEPGFPRFVLDWHKMPDGTIKASRWIDRELERLDATPSAMPAVVELLLTPEGVQVLAEGFPDDVLPWGALQEGQGFRLFALAKAENAIDPVALALHRITLVRTPGTERTPAPQPMPEVEPLPVARHFPNPAAPWESYGLAGVNFDESGRFDADGSVIVDVAAKYELGRAGILSPAPVAVLDERIEKTPYRLTLRFDPNLTDGVEVILSNTKIADMWKGSEVALSLVRETTGREAGSYLLTLTRDYYAYWIRRVSAKDMARWDGTMILDLSPDVVSINLPEVITHRGTGGFVGIAKGAAFHMVVQSLSDLKYGAARMALKSVDGQWVMPDGMTKLQRLALLDPGAFDEDEYLDALVDDLVEAER